MSNTDTKPKYRYLTKARIDSTIKKYGLQIQYTKNAGYFYFLDLKTGDQVGESVMVARLHHLNIQQWRDAAASARGSVAEGYAEAEHKGATQKVAAKMREDAAKVRELIENLDELDKSARKLEKNLKPVKTWDEAVEATREELAQA